MADTTTSNRRRDVLENHATTATEKAATSAAAVDFNSIADYLLERFGPVMTAKQAADVLHHHPSHIRALCQSGDLPAFRIGDRWHLRTVELAGVIEGAA